jgi:pimeloyl-ACP methyl ester carboxylesterase
VNTPFPRIALETLGGKGPHALLIHGFGSDRMSWLANQQALETVATVSALDLPGHGASDMDVGDGSVAALTSRVEALIEARGLGPATLIGHSLGAGVALALAARRPDLTRALILISPPGLGAEIDASFLTTFSRLSSPDETEAFLRRLVVRPRLIGKPLIGLVLAQLAKPGARRALGSIADHIVADPAILESAAAAVAASPIPRLAIWGEKDAINPLSHAKLAAFGGETRIIADAGHLPHVENQRMVNAEMTRFLAAVNRGDG